MAAEYGCCTECGRLIARIIISEFAWINTCVNILMKCVNK
jgi:hypothetical protein